MRPIAILAFMIVSRPSLAQTPDGEPDAVEASSAGFALESHDRRFRLELGGYLQADSRLYLDDDDDRPASTFLLRRARPVLAAKVWRAFGLRLMPDFGDGRAVIQDAHVDAEPWRALHIRAGKFKSPFGLERLASGASLLFVERAFPTALAPNRDIGLELSGELLSGAFGYALALLDGAPDGASVDGDTDDDKDLAGRVWARPFQSSGIEALAGLELGIAGTWGRPEGAVEAGYRTPGQQAFFQYLSDGTDEGNVVADGRRWRATGHFYWHFDRLGLLGEYVRASHRVRLGRAARALEHQAWQLAGTFLLTRDEASYRGVEPADPIDVAAGHWGAVEIEARLSELYIDSDAFPTFASASSSARRARDMGLCLSYWPVRSFKLQIDLQRTTFLGGAQAGNRPAENVLFTRLQARI